VKFCENYVILIIGKGRMYMKSAKLKLKAKKNLTKNLGPLVIATLIFMIFEAIFYGVAKVVAAPWISSLLMLIVNALFLPGFIKMALKVVRGQKTTIEDLFSETELFFKYIGISLVLFAIFLILGLLAAIDFRSLIAIMFFNAQINIALAIFLIAFGIILAVAILLVTIYIAISFSQVVFVLVDEPKLSIKNILSKSFDMMENYIIEYLVLVLSFIGWFILCILTFGLLFLLIVPYFVVTAALFYEIVKKEYQEYEEKEKSKELSSKKETIEKKVKKESAPKKTATKPVAKKTTRKAAPKKTTTKPVAKKTTTKKSTK